MCVCRCVCVVISSLLLTTLLSDKDIPWVLVVLNDQMPVLITGMQKYRETFPEDEF